jgi:RNA polymerase sigma factor (sigma-70 family)
MATNQLTQVIQTLRRAALPQEGAGLTDGQLLECYLTTRAETAFAALVHRHGPMVWGVCRRLLRSHQDAEDAFQATFLVLVRKAASLMCRELVANWLYGVAHQTSLKARATITRRQGREKQVTAIPEPQTVRPELWNDLQAVLDQELSRLPDKYRAVIVLCDLEGKTRKEAARHFHLPEGTVASRLATARAMLAKRLARTGVTVPGSALAVALSSQNASAGLPASVALSTIKAASLLAAGKATAGACSAQAVALAEGVLKTMLLTKLKIATAVLVAVAMLGTGVAVLTGQAPGERQAAPGQQTAAQEQTKSPTPDARRTAPTKTEPLPTVVTGTITAVNVDARSLTIRRQEGEASYNVSKVAHISIDCQPGDLSALPVGANVTLSQFLDPRTARDIQANGPAIFGTVKAVNVQDSTITVKGQPDRTFKVAADTEIFIDGKPGKLAGIPEGANLHALYVRVDQKTVRGVNVEGPGFHNVSVKAVDAANNTLTFDDKAPAPMTGKTLRVADNLELAIEGKPGKLSSLPGGAYVDMTLTVDGLMVRRMNAQGPHVGDCGGSQVKAVDVQARTITFEDKCSPEVAGKTFGVAPDALILIDGKGGKLTELPAGAYVDMVLSLDRRTARYVYAQGPNIGDCGGSMVKTIDPERNTITFDDRACAAVAGKTFALHKDASVAIDGRRGRLTELPVGCFANLKLSADSRQAIEMRAQGPAMTGIARTVDVAGRTITVNDAALQVAADAVIVIDGQRGELTGLPTGVTLSLRLHVDQKTVGSINANTK